MDRWLESGQGHLLVCRGEDSTVQMIRPLVLYESVDIYPSGGVMVNKARGIRHGAQSVFRIEFSSLHIAAIIIHHGMRYAYPVTIDQVGAPGQKLWYLP